MYSEFILTSFSSGMVTCVQGAYQMTTTLVPKWYLGGIVGNGVFLELLSQLTSVALYLKQDPFLLL